MTSQGLTIADYAVVAVFFAAMVGVGVFFSRRRQDAGTFFGSDKNELLATPWTAARQASLSFTVSWSLLKSMSIELVMPSIGSLSL